MTYLQHQEWKNAVRAIAGRASGAGGYGCMLTFHRVAAAQDWQNNPDRDFYLNAAFLDRLLGYLKRTGWTIATIDQMLEGLRRNDGRRYVNFSIDDCYRDTFELAVPLFQKHDAPVTLFVATGIPDESLSIYWAGLETILAENSSVHYKGKELKLESLEDKRKAYARILADWDHGANQEDEYLAFCRANRADPEGLRQRHAISWQMLKELAASPLVEIGSHTVSHRRVSDLPDIRAFEEIAQSRKSLQEKLGVPARHFAFPYGREADCSARDFGFVRKAGYATASTTRKGLVMRNGDDFKLPRSTINGRYQNPVMMELFLSGLAGAAAEVLNRV